MQNTIVFHSKSPYFGSSMDDVYIQNFFQKKAFFKIFLEKI